MNRTLAKETRAMIVKTRKIIQLSKERRERLQKRSGFSDPELAKRVWLSIFGPPQNH